MVRRRAKIRMEALPEDYDRVPGNDLTPEQAFTVSNLDPALQKALDELSPDFRVAVVLCDVVGMSYDEIADTLGVKMGRFVVVSTVAGASFVPVWKLLRSRASRSQLLLPMRY